MVADTTNDMSWDGFKSFLSGFSFTVLEENEVPVRGLISHEMIAVHCELKLLLYADSYIWADGSEGVNNRSVYGVVRRRPEVSYTAFRLVLLQRPGTVFMLGPSPSDRAQVVLDHTSHIASDLGEIRAVADFIDWDYTPEGSFIHPRLIHYSVPTVEPLSAQSRTAFEAFLARCQPEVRQFITTAA